MSEDNNLDDENSEDKPTTMKKSGNQMDEKSQSDDDTDSNASSEYEVVSRLRRKRRWKFKHLFGFQEKILGKRRRRRGGEFEYYIKWVGYDDSANEWIPESSLNCPERVAEFERAARREKLQQQKKRDSRRQRTSRRNSTRVRKRRVNIVEDDDEDENDDDDDFIVRAPAAEEETTKSVDTSISSSNKSTAAETRRDGSELKYGVEKGYKVQAVLGINRTKSDQLHYLVHYQSPTPIEDNMELIPATIAKMFCEEEIIQFYETRITWNELQTD